MMMAILSLHNKNLMIETGTEYRIKDTVYNPGTLLKNGKVYRWDKRHITKIYNLDTVDQKTLFEGTLKELKAICDIATNYECDISNTTKSISLGDTINMVDESAALFYHQEF